MTQGASTWSSGYVVDLDYVRQSYSEMMPGTLDWALTVKGLALPRFADRPFAYLELGCGYATTLIGAAAAHPEGRFYGCDFNPSHIAFARGFAAAAGLDNVTLLDDSFAEILARDLPEFDYIVLHGVYSWVDAGARSQVGEIIRRRLKPGGIVYASYNCSAGAAPIIPLRDLMRQQVATARGSMETRIQEMVASLTKLTEAGFPYFTLNPAAGGRAESMAKRPSHYIAHEYLNEAWTCFSHAEIVRDMQSAKLSFVASATIVEQFEEICVPSEWMPLVAGTKDPVLRETLKDLLMFQGMRRDVFVRGPVALPLFSSNQERLDRRFVLMRHRPFWTDEITIAGRPFVIDLANFGPLLDRLESGPATGQEILALPALQSVPADVRLARLNTLLALGHVRPASSARDEAVGRDAVGRYNLVAMRYNRDRLEAGLLLLSPVSGSFLSVEIMDQLYLLAEREAPGAIVSTVCQWLQQRGGSVTLGGQTYGWDQAPEKLAPHWQEFCRQRRPALCNFGLAA